MGQADELEVLIGCSPSGANGSAVAEDPELAEWLRRGLTASR
jgi:hypothetical protein